MADIPDIRQNVQADFTVNSEFEITVQSQDENEIIVDLQVPAEAEVDLPDNNEFDVQLQSPPFTDAEFGVIYQVEGASVLYATTNTWNLRPDLIAKRGWIYLYSDWKQDVVGRNIAGIKVGDGTQKLIDLPFIDEMLFQHIEDKVIHITQEEREFWNNKVRCYISETNSSILVFTTN